MAFICRNRNFLASVIRFTSGFQRMGYNSSSNHFYSTGIDKKSYNVLNSDGEIIVCWHPDQIPLSEHTKPMPEFQPEFIEEDSVLKVQYRREAASRFKPDGPTVQELAKLTYTTKHRWYPNNEKKYEDPNPPIDREGI